MADMGGHALYLNWNDLQLGRGETIADTARVVSRYVHAVMMRVRDHSTIVEFAKHSDVPVINGLSNLEHPCQIIGDLLTILEKKGGFDIKLSWVGDGNNVCNSLILASAILGFDMSVATPEGYEPPKEILEKAEKLGGNVEILRDPFEAVKGADVIYTDVWTSMGQETEAKKRRDAFKKFPELYLPDITPEANEIVDDFKIDYKDESSRRETLNILATLTAFTAETLCNAIKQCFVPDLIIFSGGGIHNKTLMNNIYDRLDGTKIVDTSFFGIPPDMKEAAAFAVLGNECIMGSPANLPSGTGASRPVILGKICGERAL